ncbi:protein of unknown function [Methylorubrum extorquens]|uniref:Uncharacterized protein n=1 Tax=Methylorubrum extorquens TaxID=408 RepID=A0A2N9AIA0_METEX|nr:protein of unknown function [Methylorubrum extorquens]
MSASSRLNAGSQQMHKWRRSASAPFAQLDERAQRVDETALAVGPCP